MKELGYTNVTWQSIKSLRVQKSIKSLRVQRGPNDICKEQNED